jgi:hypothetical protein
MDCVRNAGGKNRGHFSDIYAILAGLTIPENMLKNIQVLSCTMSMGVCLATSARRFHEDMEELTHNKEGLFR